MRTPTTPTISPGIAPEGPFKGLPGWHYKIPGTTVTLHTNGIGAMATKVWNALVGNRLDISDGWKERMLDGLCEQMPWVPCVDQDHPELTALVLDGRARWKELHEYADAYPDRPTVEEATAARQWLASWRERIPSYGCRCRKHFAEIEEGRPVDLSTHDRFYRWTVDVHNATNIMLGKKIWVEELD